jgi:hypothetical protein
LFSSVSSGVQWIRNGQLISGATGAILYITQNGVYRAIVVNANDCASDSSNAISVTNVALPVIGFDGLNVYPNPSFGRVWVQFQTSDIQPVHWALLNSLGQVVRYDFLPNQSGPLQRSELDFSDLATGLYTIRLEQSNRVGQVKFMIRR